MPEIFVCSGCWEPVGVDYVCGSSAMKFGIGEPRLYGLFHLKCFQRMVKEVEQTKIKPKPRRHWFEFLGF